MQYMLIMTETARDFARREDPAEAGAYWGAWRDYVDAMGAAGIIVSGEGLEGPATATTVRLRDGRRQIQDGPYADVKEQLGGYFIIEVPDLDAALDWAVRAPSAPTAAVEIRPVMPPRTLESRSP